MKTSIAIDKLINIAPIIADMRPKLQKDENFKKFMETYKSGDGKADNLDFVLRILPVFLKDYKKEVYELLAIVCDKTVKEVEEQSFGQTVKTVKELIEDDDFKSFFIDA